jgi:hypothetical protein
MSSTVTSAIEEIVRLQFLPESERADYYDTVVDPLVRVQSAAVLADPSVDMLEGWLRLQAAAFGLVVEGIGDVTLDLVLRAPDEFAEAADRLPAEQRFKIDVLRREFDKVDMVPQDLVERSEALLVESTAAFEGVTTIANRMTTRVFAEFVRTSTSHNSRGYPIEHGTLTVFASDGSVAGSYETNTGGGAPSFRTRLGPCPPGVFLVSNHRPNRTTQGMVFNSVGYSFNVDPTDGTNVFGRSLLRIHPDGNPVGTLGCLGVREPAARLRECESAIASLLTSIGLFKLLIRYP